MLTFACLRRPRWCETYGAKTEIIGAQSQDFVQFVRYRHRRVPHSKPNQCHLPEPDYDPIRLAYLAFACWVVRRLLCDDLGVLSAALTAAIRG